MVAFIVLIKSPYNLSSNLYNSVEKWFSPCSLNRFLLISKVPTLGFSIVGDLVGNLLIAILLLDPASSILLDGHVKWLLFLWSIFRDIRLVLPKVAVLAVVVHVVIIRDGQLAADFGFLNLASDEAVLRSGAEVLFANRFYTEVYNSSADLHSFIESGD